MPENSLPLDSSDPPTAFSTYRHPSVLPLDIEEDRYWNPQSKTSLTLDDWGSLQGATLVERLRTVNGQPLDAQAHLDRLQQSAAILGIAWPKYLTCKVIERVVQRNKSAYIDSDFAIVVLLTPGHHGDRPSGSRPTVIVHATPLNWPQLAHWYTQGQTLISASCRNVPSACWSPHMKTRSRLHYFLADSQAAQSGVPYAGAIMLSVDGQVTESSVANLMVVQGDRLLIPPSDSVLQGLSLQRTLRLAGQLGIDHQELPLTIETLHQAEAILMSGSSGCLWPTARFDQTDFDQPTNHRIYVALQHAWAREIQLDYVQQAVGLVAPATMQQS